MKKEHVMIDASLALLLIASQFPLWKELSIEPIATSGWDNRTFHLGKDMLIRLPSAADYELQVEKEHRWLPKLAHALPLPIPVPLAMGKPEYGYPWKWSVYRWLECESAASTKIGDLAEFATHLANFLTALQTIDTAGGPSPGLHSFFRGGPLSVYDSETRRCITSLKDKIDVKMTTEVWETALSTQWVHPPVWVHGDISAGNLLVRDGKLAAVIDFGQLAIGDPACDLAINWTMFHGKSRETFQNALPLDQGTWARARGWTLWKALIVAAGFSDPNNLESKRSWRIIEDVIADHLKFIRSL